MNKSVLQNGCNPSTNCIIHSCVLQCVLDCACNYVIKSILHIKKYSYCIFSKFKDLFDPYNHLMDSCICGSSPNESMLRCRDVYSYQIILNVGVQYCFNGLKKERTQTDCSVIFRLSMSPGFLPLE